MVFRDDDVGVPKPLLRAQPALENDGNTNVTARQTRPGLMHETGERLQNGTLV